MWTSRFTSSREFQELYAPTLLRLTRKKYWTCHRSLESLFVTFSVIEINSAELLWQKEPLMRTVPDLHFCPINPAQKRSIKYYFSPERSSYFPVVLEKSQISRWYLFSLKITTMHFDVPVHRATCCEKELGYSDWIWFFTLFCSQFILITRY